MFDWPIVSWWNALSKAVSNSQALSPKKTASHIERKMLVWRLLAKLVCGFAFWYWVFEKRCVFIPSAVDSPMDSRVIMIGDPQEADTNIQWVANEKALLWSHDCVVLRVWLGHHHWLEMSLISTLAAAQAFGNGTKWNSVLVATINRASQLRTKPAGSLPFLVAWS